MNPGKNPKRGTVSKRVLRKKSRAQRRAICICSHALDFFPESALGNGPKKWHIILFRTAYFPWYWHMPFEISISRYSNENCLHMKFWFFVLTVTSPAKFLDFLRDCARWNWRIRVNLWSCANISSFKDPHFWVFFPISRKASWKGDEVRKAKRDRLSTLDYLEISIWFKCQPIWECVQNALEFNKYRLIIGYLNLNSICCLDKPNLHKKGSIWKYSKH